MGGVNPGWMRTARRGRGAEVDRIGMLDGWQRELLGEFAEGASVYDVAERRGIHPRKVQRQLQTIYSSLDLDLRTRSRPIVRAVGLYSAWEERQRGLRLRPE